MGFRDKSWRDSSQGPLTDVQPRQGSNAGPPFSSRNNTQGTRTVTSSGNASAKKSGFYRPMQTVFEDETQGKAPPVPKIPYNTPNGQYRPSSGRSRASNFDMHQPKVQPNIDRDNLLKHEFQRGMIINAPLYEEDRNQGMSCAGSDWRSITATGMVYGKPRYMIIVALYAKHYKAVPVYTFGKRGLAGKEHYANEFISIRDGRIAQRNFRKLSEYNELVTQGDGARIHELALAWITHPVSRDYDLSIKVCGTLTQDSLEELLAHMKEENNRGLGI